MEQGRLAMCHAFHIKYKTALSPILPAGIYTIWVQGHSPSPYLIDHYSPVSINVGAVGRDFTTTGFGTLFDMAATGGTSTKTFDISTSNTGSSAFSVSGDTVTVSVEGGPESNGVLPVGIGAISVTPSSFTLAKGETHTISVSISGGSLGPGEYPLTIRATGTNSAGQKVTHLIPVLLDIATASTSSQYVDILGFAIFRITAVNSNSVDGYAISGVYLDQNDPALRRGQVARLVPWN
jgi:hypothetical protein